jgi:small ligand-binding sensory domain FIST
MKPFLHGHATHPDWRSALAAAAAQIDAQQRSAAQRASPTLGFAYFTDHYAPHAEGLLTELRRRWPGVSWVGAVGVGVLASGVEYFDMPALSLLLAELPASQFRVFSGVAPLAPSSFPANTALVHADAATPDIAELLHEMSERTAGRYLFGGVAASRTRSITLADGVFEGGLSGVAFTGEVPLLSRVTQGCQPVGPVREVTSVERNVVFTLDEQPALDVLLRDIGADPDEPRGALQRLRQTLAGLSDPADQALARPGQFGVDTRVRHVIGIDPQQRGVALAEVVEPGSQLAFCQRHAEAAARDLTRICAEVRDEVEQGLPQDAALLHAAPRDDGAPAEPRIAGALFISCAGRGGPHFGRPSAEAQMVQRALGDVPLAGFFAGGEIAHRHLYGYTAVLTVFGC